MIESPEALTAAVLALGALSVTPMTAVADTVPGAPAGQATGTATRDRVPNSRAAGPPEARFSASYVCRLPILGPRPVTVTASLTAAPDHPVVGRTVRFRLHIVGLGLRSPISIASWVAVATVHVSGAQTASFPVTGAGGVVRPRRPVTGMLTGGWIPRVAGTDEFRGGNVTITAAVPPLGDVTIPCTPSAPRPVAATLTIAPAPYRLSLARR